MSNFIDRSIKLLKHENFPSFNKSLINNALETFKNWNLSTDKDNINAALPILSYSKFIDVNPEELSDNLIINNITYALSTLIDNYSNMAYKSIHD